MQKFLKWLRLHAPGYWLLYYRLRRIESTLREFTESGLWSQVDVLQDRVKLEYEQREIVQDSLDRMYKDVYRLQQKVKLIEDLLLDYLPGKVQDDTISLRLRLHRLTTNLYKLQEREAQYSFPSVDLTNEIEETKRRIDEARAELDARQQR